MQAKTGVLTPGTPALVPIADTYPHGITINILPGSPSGVLWYRLDGVDPVAEGDDSFPCFDSVFIPHPAVGAGYSPPEGAEPVEVRLISPVALKYTVEGNRTWKRV